VAAGASVAAGAFVAAGASVAGAGPHAESTMVRAAKRQKANSKFFFISSFLLWFLGYEI
jgi:hypothetical protein